MITEIYADSLFAVNFSMDFLALFITGKTLHAAIRPLRLAAASVLGAVFATAMVVFDRNDYIIRLIWQIAFVACAVSMCAIAYGGNILKEIPVFIAVNLGLGGIMSALYGYVRQSGLAIMSDNNPIPEVHASSPILFLIFAAISGAVSLIYGRIRSSSVKRREVMAEVEILGKSKTLRLLVDSGNLLCEPISGRPVIVVSIAKLRGFIPAEIIDKPAVDITSLSPEHKRIIRLIPAKSVMGGGLMTGILPDKVLCDGRRIETVIGITMEDFNDCDGIIPETLLI